jgi:hypothetical protein
MREIKFRAWNKETNKMCDAESLQEMLHRERNNGIAEGSLKMEQSSIDEANKEYEHLILMQYTGLKDKNGKEIYEGDMLSYKLKQGWEIFFEDGHYYMMCDGHSYLLEKIRVQISEVIGNIYENPEFLKEK